MSHKAFLMVKVMIENPADRPAFDHWYATDHMPKSIERTGAEGASRFWSHSDPRVHCCLYQYASMEALAAARSRPGREVGPREFDAAWPGTVRSIEILERVQTTEAA